MIRILLETIEILFVRGLNFHVENLKINFSYFLGTAVIDSIVLITFIR